MLSKKKIPRKHKREVKRLLLFTVCCIITVIIVGGGLYYLIAVKFHKPLYISPISNRPLSKASQNDPKLALIERGLREKQLEYASIKALDGGYEVSLKKGGIVLVSTSKEVTQQLSSLQFILARLTMEGKLFKRLDLRFDKPTIVFK